MAFEPPIFEAIPSPAEENPRLSISYALDQIRFALEEDEEMFEFCWFAREYGRIVRHHRMHAHLRMTKTWNAYVLAQDRHLESVTKSLKDKAVVCGISTGPAHELYWDFEAQLNATGSCLDTLARICSLEHKNDVPTSFNRFRKLDPGGSASLFESAYECWVEGLKAYRDCFTHYSPVDTLLLVSSDLKGQVWRTSAKLPKNPSSKHIVYFEYDGRRRDVLRYSIYAYSELCKFETRCARYVLKQFKLGHYPNKSANLHRLGR